MLHCVVTDFYYENREVSVGALTIKLGFAIRIFGIFGLQKIAFVSLQKHASHGRVKQSGLRAHEPPLSEVYCHPIQTSIPNKCIKVSIICHEH